MPEHPTFQELRDGATYTLAATGEPIKALGPFIPGRAIYIRRANGAHEYCSTRALYKAASAAPAKPEYEALVERVALAIEDAMFADNSAEPTSIIAARAAIEIIERLEA